jgi:hypothetical protein
MIENKIPKPAIAIGKIGPIPPKHLEYFRPYL